MWLDGIVNNLDKAYIYVRKTDGTIYNTTITTLLVSLVRDLSHYEAGIIKISFTVPADFPSWADINLYQSYIYLGNSASGVYIIALYFDFLDMLNLQMQAGQDWTLYLTFMPIYSK